MLRDDVARAGGEEKDRKKSFETTPGEEVKQEEEEM